ncbi:hypothetical protein ACNJ7E_18115 [Rhodococcus sp. NM-2]|uniref:hypothetical protein n=1 Tax=Rhodococcus sp. NM-2 TaxID=3401174 RepID=UPI003AAF19DA
MRCARACGVTAALWVLVACGSGTGTESGDTSAAPAETAGAQDGRDRAAEMARYNADLAAFVAAFRSRYPELASNRNDESIAHIAIEPCIDLANGADEQTVTTTIADQAENRGTLPTPEQAQQIYRLVEPICP